MEPYDANKRIELLEFNLGYSKRGYPSICMRCKGCCSETKIGVAVQRKRMADEKDILSMHFREVFRAEKARRYVCMERADIPGNC